MRSQIPVCQPSITYKSIGRSPAGAARHLFIHALNEIHSLRKGFRMSMAADRIDQTGGFHAGGHGVSLSLLV